MRYLCAALLGMLPLVPSAQGLGIKRYLDVSTGVGFVGAPHFAGLGSTPLLSGLVSTLGIGLRLKWPSELRTLRGASPWIDAEGLSVHGGAGTSDRKAIALDAGFALPVSRGHNVWLGPFVRYLQVIETNPSDLDKRASGGLFAGLLFEIGFSALSASKRGGDH